MSSGFPSDDDSDQAPLDDNMTMSIVAIFLFFPLAIPAVMSASKVRQLAAEGHYAEAQAAADESRRWSRIALIVGLTLYGILIVCCVGISAANI